MEIWTITEVLLEEKVADAVLNWNEAFKSRDEAVAAIVSHYQSQAEEDSDLAIDMSIFDMTDVATDDVQFYIAPFATLISVSKSILQ